jgi:RNA polymerase sigma factor (TIGR02999 family)
VTGTNARGSLHGVRRVGIASSPPPAGDPQLYIIGVSGANSPRALPVAKLTRLPRGFNDMGNGEESLTSLLARWGGGDRTDEDKLLRRLYPELRQMAAAHAARSGDALTLRPTELANEIYLRLHEQRRDDWHSRAHFFGFVAGVLRHVIIDYLRERGAQKRGGGRLFIEISELQAHETPHLDDDTDWLEVDQVLRELEQLDPDCARVVEMRIFGGMTTEEIAVANGQSVATIGRRWRFARTWLARRLGPAAQ